MSENRQFTRRQVDVEYERDREVKDNFKFPCIRYRYTYQPYILRDIPIPLTSDI